MEEEYSGVLVIIMVCVSAFQNFRHVTRQKRVTIPVYYIHVIII